MASTLEVCMLETPSEQDFQCEFKIGESVITLTKGLFPSFIEFESGPVHLSLSSNSQPLGSLSISLEDLLKGPSLSFTSDEGIVSQVELSVKYTNSPVCSKCPSILKSLLDVKDALTSAFEDTEIEEIPENEPLLEKLSSSIQTQTQQFKAYKDITEEYRKTRKDMETANKKSSDQLTFHIKSLNHKIKDLKDAQSKVIEQIEEEKRKHGELMETIAELTQTVPEDTPQVTVDPPSFVKNELMENIIKEFDSKLGEYTQRIEELEKQNVELRKTNFELKNHYQPSNLSLANKTEMLNLQSELAHLDISNRATSQAILHANNKLSLYKTESKRLQEEKSEVQQLLESLESALEKSKADREAQSVLNQSTIDQNNLEKNELEKQIHEAKAELEQLQQSSEEASVNVEQLKERYEGLIAEKRAQIQGNNQNLTEITHKNYEELTKTLKEHSGIRNGLIGLKEKRSLQEGEIDELQIEKIAYLASKTNEELKEAVLDHRKHQSEAVERQVGIIEEKNTALIEQLSTLTNLIKLNIEKDQTSAVNHTQLQEELAGKQSEINELKERIRRAKTQKPKYTAIKEDPVDQALAEYLNSLKEPLDIQFVREDSGVYYFGSRRVFVKIEGGKIILRVGGGYLRIEEFIKLYTIEEFEKLKNRQKMMKEKANTKNQHFIVEKSSVRSKTGDGVEEVKRTYTPNAPPESATAKKRNSSHAKKG